MNKETKLRVHLESIIFEDMPEGTALNAEEIDVLCDLASLEQRKRAYERAKTKSPRLLPDEIDDEKADEIVIIGNDVSVASTDGYKDVEHVCFECDGPCWVSMKNANLPGAKYCCGNCFIKKHSDKPSFTTKADMDEFLKHEGLTGRIDYKNALKYVDLLIQREKEKLQ